MANAIVFKIMHTKYQVAPISMNAMQTGQMNENVYLSCMNQH